MEKLRLEGLCFGYNKKLVLEDFDFVLKQGDVRGLLGASGSGKTTILRLIAGLERPTKGAIYIDNKAVSTDTMFVEPEKRKVGYVFQDYGLFPHMTVEKNIAYGLHKHKKQDKKDIVNEMLSLINMEGYRKAYPHQLSGGQQQRLALARALAPRPSLLLLDEPFSSLDEQTKGKIRQEVKAIIEKFGISCILSTHDKGDIEAICTSSTGLVD